MFLKYTAVAVRVAEEDDHAPVPNSILIILTYRVAMACSEHTALVLKNN
jgi:hypothetical protein